MSARPSVFRHSSQQWPKIERCATRVGELLLAIILLSLSLSMARHVQFLDPGYLDLLLCRGWDGVRDARVRDRERETV